MKKSLADENRQKNDFRCTSYVSDCTCLRYQISKLLDKQERNLSKICISFEKSQSKGTIEITPMRIAFLDTFMYLNKYVFFCDIRLSKMRLNTKIYVNKSKISFGSVRFFCV